MAAARFYSAFEICVFQIRYRSLKIVGTFSKITLYYLQTNATTKKVVFWLIWILHRCLIWWSSSMCYPQNIFRQNVPWWNTLELNTHRGENRLWRVRRDQDDKAQNACMLIILYQHHNISSMISKRPNSTPKELWCNMRRSSITCWQKIGNVIFTLSF